MPEDKNDIEPFLFFERLLAEMNEDACCPLVKFIVNSMKSAELSASELNNRLSQRENQYERKIESINTSFVYTEKLRDCINGIESSPRKQEYKLLGATGLHISEANALILERDDHIKKEFNQAFKYWKNRSSDIIKKQTHLQKNLVKLKETESEHLEENNKLGVLLKNAQEIIDKAKQRVRGLQYIHGTTPSLVVTQCFIESVAEVVHTPPSDWQVKIGSDDSVGVNAGSRGIYTLVLAANLFIDRFASELDEEQSFKEIYSDAIETASESINSNRGELGVSIPSHFLHTSQMIGSRLKDDSPKTKAYLDAGTMIARGVTALFDKPYQKILKKMSTSGRG